MPAFPPRAPRSGRFPFRSLCSTTRLADNPSIYLKHPLHVLRPAPSFPPFARFIFPSFSLVGRKPLSPPHSTCGLFFPPWPTDYRPFIMSSFAKTDGFRPPFPHRDDCKPPRGAFPTLVLALHGSPAELDSIDVILSSFPRFPFALGPPSLSNPIPEPFEDQML